MMKFDFLFGVFLGTLLFKHSDNLSKTLQNESMSAAEGQAIARLSLTLCTPENFKLFFDKVVIYQKKFDLQDPALPRKR